MWSRYQSAGYGGAADLSMSRRCSAGIEAVVTRKSMRCSETQLQREGLRQAT